MAATGYRVEGVNQLVRDLQVIGLEVSDLKDAFSAIASRGAHIIAAFAPHRTGRLAADVRGNRAKSKAVVTAGRSSVPYAGPINYGWPKRNISANGFMQKGDHALRPYALDQLEHEINHQIRRRGLA